MSEREDDKDKVDSGEVISKPENISNENNANFYILK